MQFVHLSMNTFRVIFKTTVEHCNNILNQRFICQSTNQTCAFRHQFFPKYSSLFHKLLPYMPKTSEQSRNKNTGKREYWHPSITKTIRKHGFMQRMRTKGGRMILRRRLLKGRFFLTH